MSIKDLKDFQSDSELKPLEMLDKIKDMCETNTNVDWISCEIDVEKEFQNITDIIDKYLISKRGKNEKI
tara:strand:+ start:500 stop:706 length:207 start_codon:yes stop_codon:yes gene_type:complete